MQKNKVSIFSSPLFIIGLILSILLFGSIYVGPLSLRNYFAISLLMYSLFKFQRIHLNKIELLYIGYLFVLIICTAARNQLFEEKFYKDFLTFHVTSIGLILGVPLIINTPKKISTASLTLACVYIANAILSIMQFMQIPIAWNIAGAINISGQERIDDSNVIMSKEDLLGASVIQGLFGFVVTNGYIVASYLPLAIQKFFKAGSKISLYNLSIIVLGVVAAFLIQQRMSFYVVVAFVIILFAVKTKSITKIILLLSLGVFMPLLMEFFSTFDFGRLTETHDSYREQTFEVVQQVFVSNEWIFGCDINDVYKTLVIGHNSILDSLRRGGLLAFVTYVIFLTVTIISLGKGITKNYKNGNYHGCAYAVSSFLFIIYSMTHSTGIQSGAPFFWIPYTLMIASERVYSRQNMTSQTIHSFNNLIFNSKVQ